MNKKLYATRSNVFFRPRRFIFLNALPSISETIKNKLQQSNQVPNNEQFENQARINNIKGEISGMLMDANGILSDRIIREIKQQVGTVNNINVEGLLSIKSSLETEIEQRRRNMEEYTGFLMTNQKHFSKESIERYIETFADLTSLQEQNEYKALFFKTELPPMQALTKEFESFSPKRKAKWWTEFSTRGRTGRSSTDARGKIHVIQDMKKELRQECMKEVNESPTCEAMKNSMLSWLFNDKTGIADIEKNLEEIRINSKNEKNIDRQYNGFSKELRDQIDENFDEIYAKVIKPAVNLNIKGRSKPEGYPELTITEKEELLKHIRKNSEKIYAESKGSKKLTGKYDGLLEGALKNKILSETTVRLYKNWFQKELRTKGLKRAQDIIDTFATDPENVKRVARLEEFKKLPLALRKPHEKEFYEGSFSKRLHILQKLNAEKTKSKNPAEEIDGKNEEKLQEPNKLQKQIEVMKYSAAHLEQYQQWEKAIQMYESILELNPAEKDIKNRVEYLKKIHQKTAVEKKENGLEVKPETIQASLEKIMQRPTIKKKREAMTLTNLIVILAGNRERHHHGIARNADRMTDLTNDEREMKQNLVQTTNGEMTLEKKGSKVHTIEVRKINVTKFSHQSDEENKQKYLEMKEELSAYQNNSQLIEPGMEGLELINEKGETFTAKEGRNEADFLNQQMIDELIENIAVDLGLIPLTLPLIRLIEQQIKRNDLSTNLKETA